MTNSVENAATTADTSWTDDRLDRKSDATYLTNYLVGRYANKPTERGFVLAINGEWGQGKSYLQKNWLLDLQKDYPAVYFDAWQNDFTPQPLVAFIAELDKALHSYFDRLPGSDGVLNSTKQAAQKIWNVAKAAVIPLLAKKALNMSIVELQELYDTALLATADAEDSKINQNDISSAIDKLEKACAETLKEHTSLQQAIHSFRGKLSLLTTTLAESSDTNLPIFVFIDELDRCRPDYAIELLEGVKHLFGVPGIYFVVSINRTQLSESIKAVYGSGFNGQQYLKRFFDLEYTLPRPSSVAFSKALFANFDVPASRFVVGLNDDFSNAEDRAHALFSQYADYFSAELRDQQQIYQIVEAAILSITGPIHLHFLYFLAFIYHRDNDAFELLLNNGTVSNFEPYQRLFHGRPPRNGSFTVTRRDTNQALVQQQVRIEDIANVYLAAFRTTIHAIRNINARHFPQTLLTSIAGENGTIPSISKYPEIVRHSGNISA